MNTPKTYPDLQKLTVDSFWCVTEQDADAFWKKLAEAGILAVPAEATGAMIGAGGAKMFIAELAAAKPRDAAEAIINAALEVGALRQEEE